MLQAKLKQFIYTTEIPVAFCRYVINNHINTTKNLHTIQYTYTYLSTTSQIKSSKRSNNLTQQILTSIEMQDHSYGGTMDGQIENGNQCENAEHTLKLQITAVKDVKCHR